MTNSPRAARVSRILLPALATMWTVLALPTPAIAQNENETVGFSSTHVFDGGYFGENVDTLNGNLTLTMPIGPSYQVSNTLNYQLKLFYNSRVWEFLDTTGYSSRSNLFGEGAQGLGFNLSFGRLYLDYTNPNSQPEWRWYFVTPDGNKHDLGEEMGGSEALPTPTVRISSDTTYYHVDFNDATSAEKITITNGTGIRYTLGHRVPRSAGSWRRILQVRARFPTIRRAGIVTAMRGTTL